mmetsp:Transcript_22755/g.57747  ORF Transcript_22755/g.57747 Transcript_22755/m.57747 type:complete len:80 (-) Transcript_22755:12-251(-)
MRPGAREECVEGDRMREGDRMASRNSPLRLTNSPPRLTESDLVRLNVAMPAARETAAEQDTLTARSPAGGYTAEAALAK